MSVVFVCNAMKEAEFLWLHKNTFLKKENIVQRGCMFPPILVIPMSNKATLGEIRTSILYWVRQSGITQRLVLKKDGRWKKEN